MPLILSAAAPEGPEATALFEARQPPSVFAQATFTARQPVPVETSALFTALAPVATPNGASPLLTYDVDITGLPGEVLAATYDHTGPYEDLEVTIAGLYPLESPDVLVQLTGYADGVIVGELPTRTFLSLSQEPETDEAAGTTTYRYRTSLDDILRGLKLPELVPWKLNPSANLCAERQRLGVSGFVQQVFRIRVDPAFLLESDPLRNSEWIEGLIDESTLNITPLDLWGKTYGALGMELHVEPLGAGVRLVGRWPQPVTMQSGPEIPADVRLSSQPRYQRFQTPKRLTVRGAPHWTPLTPAALLDWIGAHPDRLALEREIMPSSEWFEAPERSGTTTVQRGARKLNGQLVAQIEVTTDDVIATETVDGQTRLRLYRGVATGLKTTRTTYDPDCPARPTYQETESRTWAYQLDTETGVLALPGPGLNTTVTVGAEVAREITRTTYTYSPQGYLAAKTTSTERTGSLEQVNAESAPGDRGAVTARETLRQSVTERWAPAGGGQWAYDPGTSGQTLLPLYDAQTGEAIRTVAVTRATPDAPRLTDQAPPSYDCRPYCEVIRDVLDDTGVTLHAGEAGRAEPREINVPMLSATDLLGAARQAMANTWHRRERTLSVAWPVGYTPGTWLSDGRVQSLRITVTPSEAGLEVTSEITCMALLADFLAPGQAGVEPYQTDPQQGRAIMLARAGQGALARVVTGWDAEAGEPLVEHAPIRFRSGFPPAPGDELEWQLVRGAREATNARR
ncbi:hypothetical protein DM785_02275 [Deinococcus actinosclerus]|nr:hypothetical protein DM785_02275 [Deinococcus actinosclerus]